MDTHHFNYNNGSYINTAGYRLLLNPNHHLADSKGYVYEHMFVMENKIGRNLKEGEVVHHINGLKNDNNPDNLMLFSSQGEHANYESKCRHFEWKTKGKICPRCKKYTTPDLLTKTLRICLDCERKRHLLWRNKNRNKIREKDSLYRATHKQQQKEAWQRWYKKKH